MCCVGGRGRTFGCCGGYARDSGSACLEVGRVLKHDKERAVLLSLRQVESIVRVVLAHTVRATGKDATGPAAPSTDTGRVLVEGLLGGQRVGDRVTRLAGILREKTRIEPALELPQFGDGACGERADLRRAHPARLGVCSLRAHLCRLCLRGQCDSILDLKRLLTRVEVVELSAHTHTHRRSASSSAAGRVAAVLQRLRWVAAQMRMGLLCGLACCACVTARLGPL